MKSSAKKVRDSRYNWLIPGWYQGLSLDRIRQKSNFFNFQKDMIVSAVGGHNELE
jgi:hypothetical protein